MGIAPACPQDQLCFRTGPGRGIRRAFCEVRGPASVGPRPNGQCGKWPGFSGRETESGESVPFVAQEEQLDPLAVFSWRDGHPQARGIFFPSRDDGAPLPEQQEAILGGRDEGEPESALGIRPKLPGEK